MNQHKGQIVTLFRLPRRVGLLSVIRMWGEVKGHSATNYPRKIRRTISYFPSAHSLNAASRTKRGSAPAAVFFHGARNARRDVARTSDEKKATPKVSAHDHMPKPQPTRCRLTGLSPWTQTLKRGGGGLDIAPSLFFFSFMF